LKIFV